MPGTLYVRPSRPKENGAKITASSREPMRLLPGQTFNRECSRGGLLLVFLSEIVDIISVSCTLESM